MIAAATVVVSKPAHHHTGFEPEINGPAIKDLHTSV
jgi:hypothetical protein